MEHGVCNKGSTILSAVFSKETKSEICIGITNNMIVESQLLGGIEMNEGNLDFLLGDVDIRFIWCKMFYLH